MEGKKKKHRKNIFSKEAIRKFIEVNDLGKEVIFMDSDIQALVKKIDENSPFLSFDERGEVTGVFKWIKEEDDSFDPGTKCYNVCLEINGKQKMFKTKSGRFVKELALANVHKGDTLKITKTGTRMQTRYTVAVVNISGIEKEEINETMVDASIPF